MRSCFVAGQMPCSSLSWCISLSSSGGLLALTRQKTTFLGLQQGQEDGILASPFGLVSDLSLGAEPGAAVELEKMDVFQPCFGLWEVNKACRGQFLLSDSPVSKPFAAKGRGLPEKHISYLL